MIPVYVGVPDDPVVARVIYSEAAPPRSDYERYMVASVVWNRVGHPAFGVPMTAEEAVASPEQFSCIGDRLNISWERSGSFADEMAVDTAQEYSAWVQSVELSRGNFQPFAGVVHYHDRSVDMPLSWDGRLWTPSLEKATEHFMFYSVSAKD